MSIRVLLADDHGVLRDGVRRLLEINDDIRVVAAVDDGAEVVGNAQRFRPDVVLMDISMPQMDGIAATRALRDKVPGAKVLILSVHSSADFIGRSVAAGARGYLIKESCGDEVVRAVRVVASGRKYFGQGVAELMRDADAQTVAGDAALEQLTESERRILALVVDGRSNAEAAALLRLSPRTVETYRARLMHKLGIEDLPALVKFAIRHGITDTE
jgi:DNA-binding NarL/FixJ family response regulator